MIPQGIWQLGDLITMIALFQQLEANGTIQSTTAFAYTYEALANHFWLEGWATGKKSA